MQALVPPFVWSLRFSTPNESTSQLTFEQYAKFFRVDPEEDYAEHSLLIQATKQRITLIALLLEASKTHQNILLNPQACEVRSQIFSTLLTGLNTYLETLLNVFALLNETQSNTMSSTSSTSDSFSMCSLSSLSSNNAACFTGTDQHNQHNQLSELDDIGIPRRPGVAWTSTLHSDSSRSWAGDLSLEVVAVLANKAVALVLMATTGSDRLTKPMCSVLQEAAGIYDWIGSANLNARDGMPEASTQVVFALSAACRGTSQQIGVSVGFIKFPSKHRLLASLCIGIARLFTSAFATLRSAAHTVSINKYLRISIACVPFIWRTLAFEQMALLDQQLSIQQAKKEGRTHNTGTSENIRYVLLLQLASTELDQVTLLRLRCDATTSTCIRQEQERMRAVVDASRSDGRRLNISEDSAIGQNVLPGPKFMSSATALEYKPPCFEGKCLTGLGAFSLTTLKTVALSAVKMDEKRKYAKAYKYYEIAVSMICIMLWHKSAWSASMGAIELTDKVRKGWYDRVVMYRTRQAQMLSSITNPSNDKSEGDGDSGGGGGSSSSSGNGNEEEKGKAKTATKVETSTNTSQGENEKNKDDDIKKNKKKLRRPSLTSRDLPRRRSKSSQGIYDAYYSDESLKKIGQQQLSNGTENRVRNQTNVVAVPDHLRSFIQVPETKEEEEEEEEESLIGAFSELRPTSTATSTSTTSVSSYPQLPPSRTNSQTSTDLPLSPRSSHIPSTSGMDLIEITKPKVIAKSHLDTRSCVTIEWNTQLHVDHISRNSTSSITTENTTKVTTKDTSKDTTKDTTKQTTEQTTEDTAEDTTNAATNLRTSSKPSIPSSIDIQHKRKKCFSTPAINTLVVPRKLTPVFQVSWCVNGGQWCIEPTLVVAGGLTTRGRYTKSDLLAGQYRFKIRIHRPNGIDTLPWSEPSDPVSCESYDNNTSEDNTQVYHYLPNGPSDQIEASNVEVPPKNTSAILRAPSVDDDGNLLTLIDSDEIVFDDPLVILGQGGFGIVSRSAVNGYRGITVAVKRVKPRVFPSSGLRNASDSERKAMQDEMLTEMVDELHAEAGILAKLSHTSIVSVFAIHLQKESPFLVMEYCDSGNLKDVLHPRKRFSAETKKQSAKRNECELNLQHRLIIAEQIASALNYLHAKFVVHRDLKPANVLLHTVPGTVPDGSISTQPRYVAKLTDFGLSRTRSRTGAGLDTVLGGSYPFLAPEAFRSTPITQSVDVYSFGIMLNEIVSLEKPWHGYEPFQITVAVAVEGKRPRIPTSLPSKETAQVVLKDVWSLVRSCWKQEANERPEVLEVCVALRSVLNQISINDGKTGGVTKV